MGNSETAATISALSDLSPYVVRRKPDIRNLATASDARFPLIQSPIEGSRHTSHTMLRGSVQRDFIAHRSEDSTTGDKTLLVRLSSGNDQTMTGSHRPVKLPSVVQWGRGLLGASQVALAIGGATVRIFFPEQLGRGLDGFMLSILIPIWAVGIAGILLLLVAWVRYPGLDTRLEVGFPERSDGKLFGPLTKSLACLILALVWLGVALAVLMEPDAALPWWEKGILFYCVTAYCCFLLYLTVLYRSAKHHATTTYLNHFNPLIGTVLVPLTWGLLIALNSAVAQGAGKAANSGPRRKETEYRPEPNVAAYGGRDPGS